MDNVGHGRPAGPSAPATDQPRQVTGAATVATVLIALHLAWQLLVTFGNWRLYFLIHDFLAGKATAEELLAADSDFIAKVGSTAGWILVGAASGIAFLVWLWRARINSELMSGAAAHRRTRGWTVGSWWTPVANLWIPYQVTTDIWRASSPRRQAPAALLGSWWACYLVALLLSPIQRNVASEIESEQDVLSAAQLDTVLTLLIVAAGLLLIVIVRRVTAWQNAALPALQR
ncbi:DUF4328 domain-containing protein [Streptomyces sp. NPDC050145]|uniref:DUF4328 domain-containing protein n=1 Tax=Streptomyces sp. NPDC050145 TaxID=3365602 RepID=UPI0037BAF181